MGKSTLIDLTGQRFGRLVVLSRSDDNKSGQVCWLCKCDCGNEKVVPTKRLRNGVTQSCGCLRADTIRNTKVKDMTGQKFGMLTVLRLDDRHAENGRAYWICRCDCGNEVSVSGKNLRAGHTSTCGCSSRKIASEKYRLDLTGERFGRLTAVSRGISPSTGEPAWLCRCDCGNEVYVNISNLRVGGQKSCGCIKPEVTRKFNIETKTTHGASTKTGTNNCDHRLYGVWSRIKDRCFNKSCTHYSDYGGRGITVCDEWKDDFTKFRDWAYASGYDRSAPKWACTIDRIDVNGNYEPSNCRWVDMKAQANNKRTNKFFEINGETHTMAEWSDLLGVSRRLVKDRVSRGWDIERALTEPCHKKTRRNTNTR